MFGFFFREARGAVCLRDWFIRKEEEGWVEGKGGGGGEKCLWMVCWGVGVFICFVWVGHQKGGRVSGFGGGRLEIAGRLGVVATLLVDEGKLATLPPL